MTGEGKSLLTYAYKYIVYYVLNEKLIGLSLLINLIFIKLTNKIKDNCCIILENNIHWIRYIVK